MGAIAGGLFAGAGSLAQSLGLVTQQGVYTSTQALLEASLLHVGAGAMSGAINAGIAGGNVGLSALTSGISAGVACGVGGVITGTDWFTKQLAPEEKFFAGLVSQAGIGAVTGGVTSEIVCGQFLHGFGQGAWTAAYGFIFNWGLHGAADDAFGSSSDQMTTVTQINGQWVVDVHDVNGYVCHCWYSVEPTDASARFSLSLDVCQGCRCITTFTTGMTSSTSGICYKDISYEWWKN
jgi:hypothetical protein